MLPFCLFVFLHFSVRVFCSCGEQGLLFVEMHRLLIAMTSVVAEHGSQDTRASVVASSGLSSCDSRALGCWLSSCGTWALLLCGMWDISGSPALAGIPCIVKWILNHETTREAPYCFLNIYSW